MNPERFYRVSQSQLSIAWHYGGIRFNGDDYIYDPATDTLTRADVVKAEAKRKRVADAAQRKRVKAAQGGLPL